jgi:hypothetical protein
VAFHLELLIYAWEIRSEISSFLSSSFRGFEPQFFQDYATSLGKRFTTGKRRDLLLASLSCCKVVNPAVQGFGSMLDGMNVENNDRAECVVMSELCTMSDNG